MMGIYSQLMGAPSTVKLRMGIFAEEGHPIELTTAKNFVMMARIGIISSVISVLEWLEMDAIYIVR